MTRFEQEKNNLIECTKKRINQLQKSLECYEDLTIDDIAKKHISNYADDTHMFVFCEDPYQYVVMNNYDKLVEIVKLWYSEEVD